MKSKHILKLVAGILIISVIVSCANRQHESRNMKRKNEKELVEALFEQAKIPFDFFSVRIGVDFSSVNQKASFSLYTRLNVDTAFGGTIKVANFVGATYLVSTDSIVFVNKREDCYFNEKLTYLSSLFGTDVEFGFFQDLLLGLPIGLDESIKYQQIPSKDDYILSSHKKKTFRKLENDRLDIEEDVMLIQYHMSNESLNVKRVNIQVPSDSVDIEINYLETKIEEGFQVPESTTIQIVHPKDSIFISLNYAPVKINDRKPIEINIPDSYNACP
jgi:hypothetical protein